MSRIIKAAFRDGLIIGFVEDMLILTAYAMMVILFLIQSS